MSQIQILILVVLISPAVQRNVDRVKLKLRAQELADATLNGNHARAADLTFPKLVTLMGGRTQYIATLKRMLAETNTQQVRILSVSAGSQTARVI